MLLTLRRDADVASTPPDGDAADGPTLTGTVTLNERPAPDAGRSPRPRRSGGRTIPVE